MLRSKTVHTIRELSTQGKSIWAIAQETGIARNTVRKYLRGTPIVAPRPKRGSKLDPFKEQIWRWIRDDHLLNCDTMLERVRPLGYTGGHSLSRTFVQPLRPPRHGQRPVQRFETAPGEQLQFDWGEFVYEQDGQLHKLYGFVATLSYSRMRFVCFRKRCDTATLIQCFMDACEYLEGLPLAMLTDRMKSVLLEMEGREPRWNPQFADFLAAIGVTPRVCRAYAPQTKGKVERRVGIIKQSFWPGVQFTDVADLNRQALAWCDQRNQRIHATTGARPVDRWAEESLRALPQGFAWARYRLEDRQVTVDGFVSVDGVLYGLPASAALTGRTVQVSVQHQTVTIWAQGQVVAQHAVRTVSGTRVEHAEQFTGVAPASTRPTAPTPVGHQRPAPVPVRRELDEYDALCGVTRQEVAA